MAPTKEPLGQSASPNLIWKRTSKATVGEPTGVVHAKMDTPESGEAPPKEVDCGSGSVFAIIERRIFLRECFAYAIRSALKQNVLAYPTIDSLVADPHVPSALTVVMYVGNWAQEADEIFERLSALSNIGHRVSVALLCDEDNPDRIFDALERGVGGYILTSSPLDIVLEALRLIGAGGTFVPASSFVEARRSRDRHVPERIGGMQLTSRQMAVIDGLRRGKANKVIAYELNMRESTVKVHVRNIMKKLNARNRTQVAFIANGMTAAASER